MESRRGFLMSASALALSGCVTAKPCPPPGLPGPPDIHTTLIDGHCHLFNATDLSVVRFLSYVLMGHYPPLASPELKASLDTPEDPDWADQLVIAALKLIGVDDIPSAVDEWTLLTGRPVPADRAPRGFTTIHDAIVERVAVLLDRKTTISRYPDADAQLRGLILRAAGRKPDEEPQSHAANLALARKALTAETSVPFNVTKAEADRFPGLDKLNIPGLFNFVGQMKRYRHCLVDELASIHVGAQQNPTLMVPAMVDFGRWLRDDPGEGSTFVDQTKVWSVISKRPGGPAVHGYVPFCPLRQVEFLKKRFASQGGPIDSPCDHDPMDVVRTALEKQGFLGVKFYPPMGFRADDNRSRGANDHPMQQDVLDDVFGKSSRTEAQTDAQTKELGRALDDALAALYKYCGDWGIPIMAHASNSFSSNCRLGELADPYYWKPVFELKTATPPPVMLAHYGAFKYPSADPTLPGNHVNRSGVCPADPTTTDLSLTWETWLATYIQKNPGRAVYTDCSYFSEAISDPATTIKNFQSLSAAQLAALGDRLVFGTDWVLLSKERYVPTYSSTVRKVVTRIFAPDPDDPMGPKHVDAIMRGNFLKYAGLWPDSPNFRRIAGVYGGDAALLKRLTMACTI